MSPRFWQCVQDIALIVATAFICTIVAPGAIERWLDSRVDRVDCKTPLKVGEARVEAVVVDGKLRRACK